MADAKETANGKEMEGVPTEETITMVVEETALAAVEEAVVKTTMTTITTMAEEAKAIMEDVDTMDVTTSINQINNTARLTSSSQCSN